MTTYVEPLQWDPVFAAAIAEDAARHPYVPPKNRRSAFVLGQPCAGDCGDRLRPAKSKQDEYPGWVPHRRKGLCNRCARPGGSQKRPMPERCVNPDCGVRMRSKKRLLAEEPGTCVHGGLGLCSTCYRKRPR